MTIGPDSSLVDVARAACTALHRVGVTAVLTGGSAATYYAPAAYQSEDIDFVAVSFATASTEDAENSLEEIGYRRQRDHYRHPSCPYPIEFPAGPLAVGREIVRAWQTERHQGTVLHVLHATDCCKDRLAAFIHWHDRSALAQALAVAAAVPDELDLVELAAWAQREGAAEHYAEFARRAGRDSGRGSMQ